MLQQSPHEGVFARRRIPSSEQSLGHAGNCFNNSLVKLTIYVYYIAENVISSSEKKVKILGLGAFFALTLVAMEQNQKTLVRLSKQNKTREEHKKVSICSAKKGKHTCRVRIVQNGVFVIVMIRCGFLFWRDLYETEVFSL